MDKTTILTQLRFWSIHCSLTALPSFILAAHLFKGPAVIPAMLLGILTFIITYTLLTSFKALDTLGNGTVRRAIRIGTKIRMWISLLTAPLLLCGLASDRGGGGSDDIAFAAILSPDVWFGMFSVNIVREAASWAGHTEFLEPGYSSANFIAVYLITITEGILISITLFIIAFITLLILNARARKVLPNPSHNPENFPPPTQ